MDKLIPFLNALSWTVIIINTLVWVIAIWAYWTVHPLRQRYARFTFNWMDVLAVLAICWLVST